MARPSRQGHLRLSHDASRHPAAHARRRPALSKHRKPRARRKAV